MTSILNAFEICSKIPMDLKINIKSFYVFNDYNNNKKNIIFITKGDKVFGLGNNFDGRLGLGHNNEVEECTEIKELSNQKINDLIIGYSFVLGRSEENQLYGWGMNSCGQLGRGYTSQLNEYLKPEKIEFLTNNEIKDISCGYGHTLVLLSNGLLYGWGYNNSGQSASREINRPTNLVINGNKEFEYIYCCDWSSFAITTNGQLFSWGNNYRGILGQGVNEVECSPREIQLSNVHKIRSNFLNTYFLTKQGFVYFCGGYEENEKQLIQNTPKKIYGLKTIRDLYFFRYEKQIICKDSENWFHSLKANKSEKIKEKFESIPELFAKHFEITPKMIHISSDDKIIDSKEDQNEDKKREETEQQLREEMKKEYETELASVEYKLELEGQQTREAIQQLQTSVDALATRLSESLNQKKNSSEEVLEEVSDVSTDENGRDLCPIDYIIPKSK